MGLSLPHLIVLALVVLLLFGRGKISDLMGDFGKGIKSFKEGINDETTHHVVSHPPAQITVQPHQPAMAAQAPVQPMSAAPANVQPAVVATPEIAAAQHGQTMLNGELVGETQTSTPTQR